MPLPEKPYYSIQELADRWHVSLSDLHDYAKHNLLEVAAWINPGGVNVYYINPLYPNLGYPTANPFQSFKGYAVIPPDLLPPLFEKQTCQIRRFINPETRDLMEIPDDQNGYQISISQLVVSRKERDRFVEFHTLPCECEPVDSECIRSTLNLA